MRVLFRALVRLGTDRAVVAWFGCAAKFLLLLRWGFAGWAGVKSCGVV